jgi:hypothetical protein
MARNLAPELIAETAERLRRRAAERFPDAGLLRPLAELEALARGAGEQAGRLGRPIWPLRASAWLLGLLGAGALFYAVRQARLAPGATSNLSDLIQGADAAVNLLLLLGAAVLWLWNREERLKRRQALALLHQLRELAHVLDMHQLTKDPSTLTAHASTAASPERRLSREDLGRYLDYCSEALALVGKIAAVYSQKAEDEAVLEAVDGIEDLSTGLARKVWQKIAILQSFEAARKGA